MNQQVSLTDAVEANILLAWEEQRKQRYEHEKLETELSRSLPHAPQDWEVIVDDIINYIDQELRKQKATTVSAFITVFSDWRPLRTPAGVWESQAGSKLRAWFDQIDEIASRYPEKEELPSQSCTALHAVVKGKAEMFVQVLQATVTQKWGTINPRFPCKWENGVFSAWFK